MRIPSGDLVPARRRRYDGGYGRRRRRRGRRLAVVGVVLLLAGGAGFWLTREESRPAAAECVLQSPSPEPVRVLPQPAQVRVVLLNGTPRPGLALLVAQQLRARGFVVVGSGNAPAALAGGSVVTHASGREDAAVVLSRHVLGSRVAGAGPVRPGAVQVVLGGDFRRLATAAEVVAATRADTPSPRPAVRVCP